MRLRLSIDGTVFDTVLSRDAESWTVVVDDTTYEATTTRDGQAWLVRFADGDVRVVVPDDRSVVVDSAKLRLRVLGFDATEAGGGAAADDGVIRAPMPGAITQLYVSEGDSVDAGQSLGVLEAMKMQNQILSPIAGTVRRLLVAKGDTVALRDALFELEAGS